EDVGDGADEGALLLAALVLGDDGGDHLALRRRRLILAARPERDRARQDGNHFTHRRTILRHHGPINERAAHSVLLGMKRSFVAFLLLLACLPLAARTRAVRPPERILWIGAHPDDEILISPILGRE